MRSRLHQNVGVEEKPRLYVSVASGTLLMENSQKSVYLRVYLNSCLMSKHNNSTRIRSIQNLISMGIWTQGRTILRMRSEMKFRRGLSNFQTDIGTLEILLYTSNFLRIS